MTNSTRSRSLSWAMQILFSVALLAAAWFGWREREVVLAWAGVAPEAAEAAAAAPAGAERGQQANPGRGRGPNAGRPLPVITAAVSQARDDLRFIAVGTGRAARSVTLRARVAGVVVEAPFAAGDAAEEGALVLQFDAEMARLTLELAEARLGAAGRRRDRLNALEGRGAASETALDEAATAAEVARIERDRALVALADRRVVAPFAGRLGIFAVELGDRLDAGDAVVTLDDRSRILVEIDAPETLAARIAPGLAVVATTPAHPGRRFAGEVAMVDSRIDPVSRTLRVRVALDNADDALRPGASFAVQIDLPGEAYAQVPELALQWALAGGYVWRVVDGRVEQAPVRLVSRRGGTALVESLEEGSQALAPGDQVVVEGVQRLRPGRRVRALGERRRRAEPEPEPEPSGRGGAP